MLQVSLEVYDKAFSKHDIESRVGLTDLHVAQVLCRFQEMLKQRYSDGKQGLSDIQLGGHGTEFTHKSVRGGRTMACVRRCNGASIL